MCAVQCVQDVPLVRIFLNTRVFVLTMKSRSPTISGTHRAALDWLFDMMNLNPMIQIKIFWVPRWLGPTSTHDRDISVIQPMISITKNEEVLGVDKLDWDLSPWRNCTLVHDQTVKLLPAKVYVSSDSVLSVGGECQEYPQSAKRKNSGSASLCRFLPHNRLLSTTPSSTASNTKLPERLLPRQCRTPTTD